jgi:hypothetical protein
MCTNNGAEIDLLRFCDKNEIIRELSALLKVGGDKDPQLFLLIEDM